MRKINETIKNVTYNRGTRVATVEQVISRADDCAHVGELYFRMSDIYRRLDMEISDEERTALETDLVTLNEELTTYLDYLNGYDA